MAGERPHALAAITQSVILCVMHWQAGERLMRMQQRHQAQRAELSAELEATQTQLEHFVEQKEQVRGGRRAARMQSGVSQRLGSHSVRVRPFPSLPHTTLSSPPPLQRV